MEDHALSGAQMPALVQRWLQSCRLSTPVWGSKITWMGPTLWFIACSSATIAATGLSSGRLTGDPATPLAVAVLWGSRQTNTHNWRLP